MKERTRGKKRDKERKKERKKQREREKEALEGKWDILLLLSLLSDIG